MRINYLLFPLLLLCLLLNACGFLESRLNLHPVASTKPHPIVKKNSEQKPAKTVRKPPRTHSKAVADKEKLNRLLEATDYLAALALIRQELGRGIGENELRVESLSAINGAISQGESALAGNNPEQAGLLFRAARDNFPETAELDRNTGLTPLELDAKINLCADKLMVAGIIAYRAGNLGKAIEQWQKIFAFQPQHQASQKAILTANIQLANLKQIETDQ
jgi:tetratricopeptide (TPR) repeat protein